MLHPFTLLHCNAFRGLNKPALLPETGTAHTLYTGIFNDKEGSY